MNRINTYMQWAITVVFLFFAFLPLAVMAQSGEKRINLQNKNISFREAFREIERQTGYSVAYEASELKAESRLSVWLKEADIDKALTQILKGTGHTYRIKGYHIIISLPPGNEQPAKARTRKLTQTIRGLVMDSQTNTPIEYATVTIQTGGSLGTTTDSLGRFRIDRNKAEAEERSQWETDGDRQSGENQLDKAVGGVTHRYVFSETAYLHSSLAATYANDHQIVDQLAEADNALIRVGDIRNSKWDVVLNTYLNKKFSSRHTNRTGITLTGLQYDLDYKVSPYPGLDRPMEQLSRDCGKSTVLSAYSSSVISLNNHWTTSLGVNARYFTLNKLVGRASHSCEMETERPSCGCLCLRTAQSQGKIRLLFHRARGERQNGI